MLANILSKLQSLFVVTLVALLIGAFALTFGGPQTEGCAPPAEGRAATVNGTHYLERDVQSTMRFMGDLLRNEQLLRLFDARGGVIEGIVERKLLADEARKLGFELSSDDALVESMRNDEILLTLGENIPSTIIPSGRIPFRFHDDLGKFNRETAEGYLRNALGLSPGAFGKWQAEERLAERMRELVRARVVASEQEIMDAYRAESDTVAIRYVHYRADHFREIQGDAEPPPSWEMENGLWIDAEYQTNLHRYTNLPPEVRARHILLRASTEEEVNAAREKAELLRARILGGASFADIALQHSEDTETAKKGGDLGFRPRGRMPAEFDAVAFGLEPGKVSEPIETSLGIHLVKVEEKREGDVSMDVAKKEIAARLYANQRAREAGKRAAEAALAALRDGKSTLDELGAKLGEVDAPFAPTVVTSLPLSRGQRAIPELDGSAALTELALSLGDEGALPEAPFAAGDDQVIFQVETRTRPAAEGPDEDDRERIAEEILERKREELLRQHVRSLRASAERRGDLTISAPPADRS
jgi:peptidyl-prolyl cis-trans isomerase D